MRAIRTHSVQARSFEDSNQTPLPLQEHFLKVPISNKMDANFEHKKINFERKERKF